MPIINQTQQKILFVLLQKEQLQSSQIHQELIALGITLALITVKRELTQMVVNKLIVPNGAGRYIYYSISNIGRVFSEVDAHKYSDVEPDRRFGMASFNFELFKNFPQELFEDQERSILIKATEKFTQNSSTLTSTLAKKELERLVIELSWKSSKIEGNTYTLLDTERLIRNNQEATGHSKEEAIMILNHKKAFDYIWSNRLKFTQISKQKLEEVHTLLIEGLDVQKGYRKGSVGITGSKYKPLDNIHQIEEAMETLFDLINKINNPYTKALVALAGISYVQPFEDGNKRSSRLATNAILMGHGLAPLSYRSVDEESYRSAMLVFYELNSIVPIKKIFQEQYIFSAENYSL